MPTPETLAPQTRIHHGETMPNPITIVEEALAKLRYGAIQLTVHDGRLVQVDVTERTRFPAKG